MAPAPQEQQHTPQQQEQQHHGQQQYYPQAQYAPPYGYPLPPQAPEHPNAVVVLVLGLVGISMFPTAIIGFVLGERARRDIVHRGAPYHWGGLLKAGWIVSLIISIVGALTLIVLVLYVIFVIGFMVFSLSQAVAY